MRRKQHTKEQKVGCPGQREQQVQRPCGLEAGCLDLLMAMMPMSNRASGFIEWCFKSSQSPLQIWGSLTNLFTKYFWLFASPGSLSGRGVGTCMCNQQLGLRWHFVLNCGWCKPRRMWKDNSGKVLGCSQQKRTYQSGQAGLCCSNKQSSAA